MIAWLGYVTYKIVFSFAGIVSGWALGKRIKQNNVASKKCIRRREK